MQYMPSGLAAKKLGLSPRTLGKITGNLFMLLPEGREDVGLYVKHGNKGLCVPDYVRAQPEERGWAYSSALVQVLEQYKVRRPSQALRLSSSMRCGHPPNPCMLHLSAHVLGKEESRCHRSMCPVQDMGTPEAQNPSFPKHRTCFVVLLGFGGLSKHAVLQKRHAWVFSMLEANPEGGSEYDVAEALPGYSTAAQTKAVADIKQWLKSLPLSRRHLCKVSRVTCRTVCCDLRTMHAPMCPRKTPSSRLCSWGDSDSHKYTTCGVCSAVLQQNE